MRFLVLSVTSGEGHNAMGKAVMECLKEKGHETMMIDYLRTTAKIRGKLAHEFYFWGLNNFGPTVHKTYDKIMARDVTKRPGKLNTFMFMTGSKKANDNVEKTIKEFKPDMIYCTHVYTAKVMSDFKKEGKYLDIPTFFTVSDYTLHAYTELANGVDYLLTPNNDFNDRLIYMGYKNEQFLPFGITVNTKFSKHALPKDKAREALGLHPDYPTFMIMSGGVGFGDNLSLIQEISKIESDKFQIIMVNGRNIKMKESIDEFIKTGNCCKCLNLGFATNVSELMDASDVLIGKIGGVAIAEAFNKGLPIIVSGDAPFQEADNVIYLGERGAIINAGCKEKTKEALEDLIAHPEKLTQMQEIVSKIAKPNATSDFVEFMEKLYNSKKEN